MKKIFLLTALTTMLIMALIDYRIRAGQNNNTASTNTRPVVTTLFYPLYFFASQIAGDTMNIYNITPAGAEPHDYEPTTQDMARIENSKLLILNGGKLEPWADKIRGDLQGKNILVIALGNDLADQQILEDGKTIQDPHIWLNPKIAKQEAKIIAQNLAGVDPANTFTYQMNLQNLEKKLDDLDAQYRQGLANCQTRDIITSHAAFGYLAHEYNLNQVAISGLSPDAEPSAKQLAEVADFAKKNRVKYIFFESLVSPKLSQTIAQEIGAQTLVLNPIEGLSDEEISGGKNYFTEMKSNLVNLRTALQCR